MSLTIIERYVSLRHRLKQISTKKREKMCEHIIDVQMYKYKTKGGIINNYEPSVPSV